MAETEPEKKSDALDRRVLDIVSELAAELGGNRAQRVRPEASLERDLGLGSLERVELLVRLEAAFGRPLEDYFLGIDTPQELARALRGSGPTDSPLPYSVSVATETASPARPVRGVTTLAEALWLRGSEEPERPHAHLLGDDGGEKALTYGQLLEAARKVAGALDDRGIRRGDTVALMLPTGSDFLIAFQATLLLGAIAVPIYPPVRLDRLEEYADRQAAILNDAGVTALLTFSRARPLAGMLQRRVATLRQVTTVPELAAFDTASQTQRVRASDAALIQYTSGSTGHPKGVLLTHQNLLSNINAIAAGLDLRPTDVGVSWLPMYHDMGLIGSWLFCLVHGVPITLLSPLAFLSRPERWLMAIHARRGTLSAAPNFAYELCVRKIPDSALEGLDLSCWRCALNGAEPVAPSTLQRFIARFSPFGFRREALMPVYGLAECSVALSFPPPGRGPQVDRIRRDAFERNGRAEIAPEDDALALSLAAVGTALPEHQIRIVDETGRELPARTVGRLVFRGPSATPGYFGKPEATAAIQLPGGFLDSGDLAYRTETDIVIAGRSKDLIIKAGRNLVPQEIEEVASEVDGVRKGGVVAFGVAHPSLGTESLVVAAETRAKNPADRERIETSIIDRVATAVGVPPDAVELLLPGSVPKTSSGKVRRTAAREMYLAGTLGRAPRRGPGVRVRRSAALALGMVGSRIAPVGRWVRMAVWILLFTPFAILLWLLAAVLPRGRWLARLERGASRLALWLAGCRLTVEGLEHLAGLGPFVLASNHASYVDIPALVAGLPIALRFVAKREVLRWPLMGTMVRRGGHLTVDRFEAQQSVADAARLGQAIASGASVLIFPEGTFQEEVGLRPFRLGAFKSAVEAGVSVVPVAIQGSRRILRGDSLDLRPGPIRLWVGPPIAPAGQGFREVVRLRDAVFDVIAAHCGEAVIEPRSSARDRA